MVMLTLNVSLCTGLIVFDIKKGSEKSEPGVSVN